VNVVIGTIWQTTVVLFPIYFVLKKFSYASITFAILLICVIFLKKNWYNKLEND